MSTYSLIIIPIAHAEAFNRMLNVIFNDSGDNLSRDASPDGKFPVTHKVGGAPLPVDFLAFLHSMGTVPFVLPPGQSYPLPGGITEQNVIDARAAVSVETSSGDVSTSELVDKCLAAMEQVHGLVFIVPSPEDN